MKSCSFQITPDDLEKTIGLIKKADPQLIVVFSSSDLMAGRNISEEILSAVPSAHVVGCSTSGELGDSVEDNSIAILCMSFEKTKFTCTSVDLPDSGYSRKCGEEIAGNLLADDLSAVLVLAPGKNVNGSHLVEGLRAVLPPEIPVSGGLAGGGLSFGTAYTLLDKTVSPDLVVAVGFYGPHINVRTGSQGGWKVFGPRRKVTKSENNVLYELDGKPALVLYKQYLGDKVDALPASGLLFPFAILNKDTKAPEVVRTILDVNEADQSLVFAGNIPEGADVSLMHAGNDELVDGAAQAAQYITMKGDTSGDSATLCISCIGRKILMGGDTEDELDAVKDVIGESSFAGFYSNGEISGVDGKTMPELHNQTMTLMYISENV